MPALLGQRDRQRRLRHGVHRRGQEGYVEGDVPGQAGRAVSARSGVTFAELRNEQDIIERDAFLNPLVLHLTNDRRADLRVCQRRPRPRHDAEGARPYSVPVGASARLAGLALERPPPPRRRGVSGGFERARDARIAMEPGRRSPPRMDVPCFRSRFGGRTESPRSRTAPQARAAPGWDRTGVEAPKIETASTRGHLRSRPPRRGDQRRARAKQALRPLPGRRRSSYERVRSCTSRRISPRGSASAASSRASRPTSALRSS